MDRMFIGTTPDLTRSETWVETGHFVKGVKLMFEELFETDGDGHITERCGFDSTGDAIPAQNTAEDYEFYNAHFAGKKSVAFLVKDQLWLFKRTYIGNKEYEDNRLSIFPKMGYDSPREAENISFSGWLPGFVVVTVANFKFSGGRMSYRALKTKTFGFTNITKAIAPDNSKK